MATPISAAPKEIAETIANKIRDGYTTAETAIDMRTWEVTSAPASLAERGGTIRLYRK